jgi:predicted transcriptional regulator of viral defense system
MYTMQVPSVMKNRLQKSQNKIMKFFERSDQKVFSRSDLATILTENRDSWRLPLRLTIDRFLDFISENGHLKRIALSPAKYPEIVRYAWGECSPYQIGLSLRPRAYLCHATALFLHGLTDQLPKSVYVNAEQSPKPVAGSLSQEAINRAFSGEQRKSNYIFPYDSLRFVLLSGKNTGRLEVGTLRGPSGEELEVTKLERTLIDITVRPAYAGGVFQVLEAYRAARARMSVNTLVATLKKLSYAYPYHQAIGFYMEKAGYEQERFLRLHKLGLEFDFYLSHGLKQTEYNQFWRLSVPKGF